LIVTLNELIKLCHANFLCFDEEIQYRFKKRFELSDNAVLPWKILLLFMTKHQF